MAEQAWSAGLPKKEHSNEWLDHLFMRAFLNISAIARK
jgi:hypothetical protein